MRPATFLVVEKEPHLGIMYNRGCLRHTTLGNSSYIAAVKERTLGAHKQPIPAGQQREMSELREHKEKRIANIARLG